MALVEENVCLQWAPQRLPYLIEVINYNGQLYRLAARRFATWHRIVLITTILGLIKNVA